MYIIHTVSSTQSLAAWGHNRAEETERQKRSLNQALNCRGDRPSGRMLWVTLSMFYGTPCLVACDRSMWFVTLSLCTQRRRFSVSIWLGKISVDVRLTLIWERMKAFFITLTISMLWPSQWRPFTTLWDLHLWNAELTTGRRQRGTYAELRWGLWWKSGRNSCPGPRC